MSRKFCIHFRRSRGNLHITLSGEFNGMCAWELIKTIKRQYAGSGRIFVNTAGLSRVMPAGAELFKSQMARKRIPHDWLYFKGNKGFKIAPNGSRVIIRNRLRQLTDTSHVRSKTICKSRIDTIHESYKEGK